MMTHDLSRRSDSMPHEVQRLAENGVGTSLGGVLVMLADGADVDDVLRAFPDLTCDDIRTLLADAELREETSMSDASKTFVSPQDFYREAVQREDVRRILAALAK
jgi:hypothetical protein